MQTGFQFCPFCGVSKLPETEKKGFDEMFAKLEAKHLIERQRHIDEMKERLEELENELSVLALSYEMSR